MPLAVVCRELGEPEVLRLEEVARAPLKAGEVRVKVQAAGLNYPDILTVAGTYQHKPDLPFIPGMEGAGDVIEVGEGVTKFTVGDKVMFGSRLNAYAQEIALAATQCKPLPLQFSYAEGAGFGTGHATAYCGLVERAQTKPGEVVLVHGAGGGVGLAAVEVGKIIGATVIAVASSEEKLAVAKSRGADHTILSTKTPFRDEVKRLTDGRGADVVFDPVGGETFENSLRCINWGARLLIVGFLGGVGMARTNLVLIKNASVMGVRAGEQVRHDPSFGPPREAALSKWIAEGRIKPNISHSLPLKDFAPAMRLLMDRKAIGRVVLLPQA